MSIDCGIAFKAVACCLGAIGFVMGANAFVGKRQLIARHAMDIVRLMVFPSIMFVKWLKL